MASFENFYFSYVCDPLQFLVLAFLIYKLLYYLRETRAVLVLAGVILGVLGLRVVSRWLGFTIIEELLDVSVTLLGIALVVIFQPELRRAFAHLGSLGRFGKLVFFRNNGNSETVSELVQAVMAMSKRRIGALIVLERKIGLRTLTEDAVRLNSKFNNLLLQSLFFPNSPLHDGAVIIQNGQIVAARAILPLSRNTNLSRTMGTRHRAAIGITEDTDAVVVVVSEETGDVSIACHGAMMHGLSEKNLALELHRLLDGNNEDLTDILSAPDEREGAADFHGDEVPAAEEFGAGSK